MGRMRRSGPALWQMEDAQEFKEYTYSRQSRLSCRWMEDRRPVFTDRAHIVTETEHFLSTALVILEGC